MLRKILIVMLSTIFIWGQTSVAFAQNYHFDAFDHMKNTFEKNKINSRGFTGQVGLSIPFGNIDRTINKPFYGFKMTYGQEIRNSDPFKYGFTRDVNLFSTGIDQYGINSVSLAHYDVLANGQQRNIFGNGTQTDVIIIVAVVAVAVAVCLAANCFDGDSY